MPPKDIRSPLVILSFTIRRKTFQEEKKISKRMYNLNFMNLLAFISLFYIKLNF